MQPAGGLGERHRESARMFRRELALWAAAGAGDPVGRQSFGKCQEPCDDSTGASPEGPVRPRLMWSAVGDKDGRVIRKGSPDVAPKATARRLLSPSEVSGRWAARERARRRPAILHWRRRPCREWPAARRTLSRLGDRP